jgi:hypothetical protein
VTTPRRTTWRRRSARAAFLASGVFAAGWAGAAAVGVVEDDAGVEPVEAAPATEIPPSPRTAATDADAMVLVNLMP